MLPTDPLQIRFHEILVTNAWADFKVSVLVSDIKQGDSKCLTFQAASEEEFKRWQQLVSCNTGGNPRVYVDPGSGGISCASHNIELDDHIVGMLLKCFFTNLFICFLQADCKNVSRMSSLVVGLKWKELIGKFEF